MGFEMWDLGFWFLLLVGLLGLLGWRAGGIPRVRMGEVPWAPRSEGLRSPFFLSFSYGVCSGLAWGIRWLCALACRVCLGGLGCEYA